MKKYLIKVDGVIKNISPYCANMDELNDWIAAQQALNVNFPRVFTIEEEIL